MSFGDVVTGIAGALWQGALLGIQYNPVFGIAGAVIAAALVGFPKAPAERRFWAGSTLVVAWLIGDGLRIIGRTRELFDGAGALSGMTPGWTAYLLLATWALVAVGVGYLAPAWAGILVGRRVTHGTGWLSAMAIAVAVSLGISSLIASLTALG